MQQEMHAVQILSTELETGRNERFLREKERKRYEVFNNVI